MIFKLFALIVAAVTGLLGLLGLHQPVPKPLPTPSTPTSTPTSTASSDSTGVPAPSTSVTAVPEPLRPVAMDMPAGTHPATKADMSKFLSHNWASTANKYAVIYMGKSQPFDGTEEIKKEFNGNVPEGLRMLTYDPTCNAVQTAVWFDGNAAGDRAYLKRTDGKVSEWIIATN